MTYKACNTNQIRHFKQLRTRLINKESEYKSIVYVYPKTIDNETQRYYDSKLHDLNIEIYTIKERLNRYVVMFHELFPVNGYENQEYCYRVKHFNSATNDFDKNEMFNKYIWGSELEYYKQKLLGRKMRDSFCDKEKGYYSAYEYYYRVN